MHLRTIASMCRCSRRMRPNAVPKITTVPAMLPRIGCCLYQSGRATRNPTSGAAVASIAIQYQLNPFTSLAGVVRPLGVRPELRGIEVDFAQVAGRVALGLVVEVLRRGVAALAAGRDRAGAHAVRAELDDGDEAVAAGAVHPLRPRIGPRAERRERSPGRRREADRDARLAVVERLD